MVGHQPHFGEWISGRLKERASIWKQERLYAQERRNLRGKGKGKDAGDDSDEEETGKRKKKKKKGKGGGGGDGDPPAKS